MIIYILRATAPLRSYLKKKGNDDWRYLLITSGNGFGEPSRARNLSNLTSGAYLRKFVDALSTTWDASHDVRSEYGQRFSLRALRASVGVLVYIETRDGRKMAEALGHEYYDPNLLKHYLPQSILDFFQERWVRLFQEGLILQAMGESDLALEASSFSSMKEVSEFLSLHALKPLTDIDVAHSTVETTTSDRRVFVSVNLPILKALRSVHIAVVQSSKPVSGMARYWAQMYAFVADWIRDSRRDDLKIILRDAESGSDSKAFGTLLYG